MKRIISLLALLLPFSVLASGDMQFRGTLVVPPCSISNGEIIKVAFGDDLGVNKIDGNNYKQPVKYTVNCKAGYTVNSLAIVIDTTQHATYDNSAIQTDKPGLGIRILVDGVAASFSTRIVVSDPDSPPAIEAVPVQDQSVTLTEGAFAATMTLRTDYM
ncbi:fimbrial protein [Citrobacter farmeri]|uniref:Pilus assembly protein n=1 Tax=Citrobacter amalonaticus Y19 TaxID=1261127 RepID=M1K4Z0_CITAM|nr:fimbrial protein [Citrobacter amalonaticus]AGE94450.1 pilus assembly protein [Citrobacter amalonaticus Y19]EKV5654377.1 fimbrial protein [Citrobacter farmeri]